MWYSDSAGGITNLWISRSGSWEFTTVEGIYYCAIDNTGVFSPDSFIVTLIP